ncbi:hypothetical protein BMT52_09505 [Escherichia coli]|nr:hypothetical protein BMT52_09505 [Escherichia coli]
MAWIVITGGWWLVAGGWWLVAGGWWLVAGVGESFNIKSRHKHIIKVKRNQLSLTSCWCGELSD